MKKINSFIVVGILLTLNIQAQQVSKFYVDFGPNDVTNGNITTNPDNNGTFWNNLITPTAGSDTLYLVDHLDVSTEMWLQVTTTFQMNGIQNGGLVTPDSSLLGEFAVATATQDYFFNTGSSQLQIGGLASDKGYVFSFFGTRNSTSTRITNYSLTGSNSFSGNHQTSGVDLGGVGYNGNNSMVLVTDTLFADVNQSIYLDVSVVEGGFAYLGLMKIEAVEVDPITPNNAPVANAGADQVLPSGTTSYELMGAGSDIDKDSLTYVWTQKTGPSVSIMDSSLATTSVHGLENGNTYTFELLVSDGLLSNTDDVSISIEAELTELRDPDLIRSFYFDFGPDDVTNGNVTPSPDVYGKYWNNPTDGSSIGSAVKVVDEENGDTAIELSVISDLNKNGIQNGGLLNPEFSKLGEFAIATATQDYFFTQSSGTIEFDGLDVNHAYVFNLFASRNTESVRITEYRLMGSNLVIDTLQTSGLGIGGNGYNGNNSEILQTKAVRPDGDGRITLRVSVVEGGFGYINTLRVDEVNAAEQFLVDFGPNDQVNGNETVSPDVFGNYWNNLNAPTASTDSLHLTSKTNESSDIYLKVARTFQMNGINHGGLLDPSTDQLNEFAVASATEDYFFTTDTSTVLIGGLNPENGYVFHLFGTRNSASTRKTEYRFTAINSFSDTLQTSGVDLGGTGYNGNNRTVLVSDTLMAKEDGTISLDVIVHEGGFAYLGFMKVDEVSPPSEPEPICPVRNENLISIMGSSVALGVGAPNNRGYAYLLNQELQARKEIGGGDWEMTNISIGGNSTLNVLARFEADLLPTCGSYVVFGLSLGNEGIKGGGQPIWQQFADNIKLLAEMAEEEGFQPIIANNYTRADFTPSEYAFIKEMNLYINYLPYPSINLLGAIDDGAGRWASGYLADAFHPNGDGHAEFFYSIVPSLFDALKAGKPIPILENEEFTTITASSENELITYEPDGTVHPYTISFEIRTTSDGGITTIETDDGTAKMEIDPSSGFAQYISAMNDTIRVEKVINDGDWHTLALTHYHAWGRTFLYADSIKASTSLEERHTLESFALGGNLEGKLPDMADYRNLMMHRSALNDEEIFTYVGGTLIQSSLELYAPLSEGQITPGQGFINLAQSTTQASSNLTVDIEEGRNGNTPTSFNLYQNYPNPFNPSTSINFDLPYNEFVRLEVFNLLGVKVATLVNEALNAGSHTISFNASKLSSGMYFYRIDAGDFVSIQKMMLIK